MEYERFNYIILDATGATEQTDYSINWSLPPSLFSEYEQGDEVYIKLESSVFSAPLNELLPLQNFAIIYLDKINIYNQQSLSSKFIFSSVPCFIMVDGTDNYLSTSSTNSNNMRLRTDRFYNLNLAVCHEDTNLQITGTPYKFIIKVSYKKKY